MPIIVIMIFVVFVVFAMIFSVIFDAKKKEKRKKDFSAETTHPASVGIVKQTDSKKEAPDTRTAYREFKPMVTTPREEMRPRVASRLEQSVTRSTGHHEEFCTVEHKKKDLYREEKNIPVTNSIGGKSAQGCGSHYGSRFVKLDEAISVAGNDLTQKDLAQAIVLGEVINRPAFKRRASIR